MNNIDAILRYKMAMAEFHKWLVGGVITQDEFFLLSTALADKHGLSSKSIYLENTCYVGKKER